MEFQDDYGVYRRTVEPSATVLAVSLDEIKYELDLIGGNSRDPQLMLFARDATDQIEADARLAVMTQTWQWHGDRFPCDEREVRMTPIQSVTHLKYYTNSVLTTLPTNQYQTDLLSAPARIRPVSGYYWPSTDCRMNAVQIEFIAGYASASAVPSMIKGAILSTIRGIYNGCPRGDGYWDMIRRIRKFGGFA